MRWQIDHLRGDRIHVYEGDRPVGTFHQALDAKTAVDARNAAVDPNGEVERARRERDLAVETMHDVVANRTKQAGDLIKKCDQLRDTIERVRALINPAAQMAQPYDDERYFREADIRAALDAPTKPDPNLERGHDDATRVGPS